jgi:hypothetical protein
MISVSSEGRRYLMTTAKRGGGKKVGKSGGVGRHSPPSRARAEQKRKSNARVNDDTSGQGMPKVGKGEVGGGKRGGGLH